MPSVLFVSYSGSFGGAEQILLDVAAGVGPRAVIASPPGALAERAGSAGLRTFMLRARSLELRGGPAVRAAALRDLAAHGREAHRLAADLASELVVLWNMRTLLGWTLGGAPGRRRSGAAGTPVVFQHNDLLPGATIGRAVRRAAGRVDLTIALSHAIAADLAPDGPLAAPVAVVHPGVDLDRFAPAAEAPLPEDPVVLVAGALVAWKRPDIALDALAAARARLPGLRLRLAGGALGPEGERLRAELAARARELGVVDAVEFLGPVGDMPAELARATCLLHTAPHEPFGLAIVEALAAGRPAVVPDAAGPAEIVDQECGRRYPAGDAPAAAAALVEVAGSRELAAELGAEGRVRARAAFGLAGTQARWRQAVGAVAPSVFGPGDERPDPVRRAAGRLAIVTVTHNSAGDLTRLLASAARELPEARVIVVDSGSTDGSVDVARAAGVEVLELGENVGFGVANNRGVATVAEPVTALLNPDVELLDSSLAELAEAALTGTDRLLAPLVLNGDGSRQDTVHPRPASAAELLAALVPPAALPGRLGVRLAPWRARRRRARRLGGGVRGPRAGPRRSAPWVRSTSGSSSTVRTWISA